MAKKATTDDDIYDPEQLDLVREVDQALDTKLTGKPVVEDLAKSIRGAAFEWDVDDIVTLATAEDFQITDSDSYARGFEILGELSLLDDRITAHYSRFDKPLNFLIGVVRKLKSPQAKDVLTRKQALSKRLGLYKAQREEAERQRREQEQAQRDADARAEQEAKAAALTRVAEQEANPVVAQSIMSEAESIRLATPFVAAPPVEEKPAVPQIPGGYTTATWKCEYVDVRQLLRAYLDGQCVLDEEAIKKGLQSFMDTQAQSLGARLSQAYPGTRAVPSYGAVQRKTTK